MLCLKSWQPEWQQVLDESIFMAHQKTKIVDFFPTIGILIFLMLFFYAATLYPGGSQFDATSKGFDWMNNYWCNLLNEHSMNGENNGARPFAIGGMAILCLSINYFFIQFSAILAKKNIWKKIIVIAGTASMFFALFIFTRWHDEMTIISSVFGAFAILGIIIELFNSQLSIYKISALLCLLLLGINNLIYYSTLGLPYLPVLQKVTFIVILLWVSQLNIKMVRMKTIDLRQEKKN